jgi:hypothetical protein
VTRDHIAAALSLISAATWIPLLAVNIRDNTGRIDGGTPSSTYGRDRCTDIAVLIAFIGVFCAIAAAVVVLC